MCTTRSVKAFLSGQLDGRIDLAPAQLNLRRALLVPDTRLLLALLRPRALAGDRDLELTLHGAVSNGLEELEFLADSAIVFYRPLPEKRLRITSSHDFGHRSGHAAAQPPASRKPQRGGPSGLCQSPQRQRVDHPQVVATDATVPAGATVVALAACCAAAGPLSKCRPMQPWAGESVDQRGGMALSQRVDTALAATSAWASAAASIATSTAASTAASHGQTVFTRGGRATARGLLARAARGASGVAASTTIGCSSCGTVTASPCTGSNLE